MAPHVHVSQVLAFVFSGLSTVIVALRFYSHRFLAGKLTASCWVILVALIFVWGSVVVNWYMIHFLDYSHIHDRDSFAKVATGSLLTLWIYRVSFILDLCLIKTSILLFYGDIAGPNRRFHHAVRALLAIVLLGGASMIFAGVFTCFPVADAWSFEVFERGLNGIRAAQCYNPGPFWLFNAGYNLATDITIWALPILFLFDFQSMPPKRRVELTAIFSIGLIAIFASAIRLNIMVFWLKDVQGQRQRTANLLLWSQVEQNTGICAASLHSLRPIFCRLLVDTRSKERPDPGLVTFTMASGMLGDQEMIRTPIIPSPSPTIASEKEFRAPREHLVPIQPTRGSGAAIWDGTQLQQVLPS